MLVIDEKALVEVNSLVYTAAPASREILRPRAGGRRLHPRGAMNPQHPATALAFDPYAGLSKRNCAYGDRGGPAAHLHRKDSPIRRDALNWANGRRGIPPNTSR